MRTLIARFLGCDRQPAVDWWEYFGSFGDDFFDEDDEVPSPAPA